jgi:protein SCO1/2
MTGHRDVPGRRRWGGALLACALAPSALWPRAAPAAADHMALGPLDPPRPAPALALTLHDGRAARLDRLLAGRWSALQLMFSGCTTTCPLQGAVFAALQSRLENRPPPVQLVSISIDALGDDTRSLSAWLKRHGAGPGWVAGVPGVRDVDRLLDFVAGRAAPGRSADRHTAQVYVFDPRGRLAFRFAELASARDIAEVLGEMQRRAAAG